MRICALDLGTKTGVAVGTVEGPIESPTTWVLATPKALHAAKQIRLDRRCDIRIPELWNRLTNLHLVTPLDWLVLEDVQFQSSTQATQLWSSFRATVWLFATVNRIQIECLATGKLKKFATGSGSADKPAMARALCRQIPRFVLEKELVKDTVTGIYLTDDAVDALHLLKWATITFRKTV